jgi:predicted phosphohydrolase
MPHLYAIADLHLSSTESYTDDAYADLDKRKRLIEENWRRLIKSGDTVVLAGDTSFAKTLTEAADDFAFLHSLPGEKILIRGNHDGYFTSTAKMNAFKASRGFDTLHFLRNNHFPIGKFAVCGTRGYDISLALYDNDEARKLLLREHQRLTLSLESAEKQKLEPIVFLHYPPILSFAVDEDALRIMKNFGVKKCFYGHLHGEYTKNAFTGDKMGIKFGIISADVAKFIPEYIQNIVQNGETA